MAFLLKRIPKLKSKARLNFRASISTVKQERIEYFEDMARVWWDPNGRFRGSHTFLPFRVEFMSKHLMARMMIPQNTDNKAQLFKGIKVLDMGCGAGLFTERLASLGATMTGVDPAPLVIQVARNHLATVSNDLSSNVTYINGTAEEHALTNSDHYDVVVAFMVLENIQHRQYFLKNCFQLLKPGGSLFLQTANKNWFNLLILYLLTYTSKFAPKNILTYARALSKQQVIDYLRNLNCHSVDVEGFKILINGKGAYWAKLNPHMLLFHAVKH